MEGLTMLPLTNKTDAIAVDCTLIQRFREGQYDRVMVPTSMAPSVGVIDTSSGAVVSPPVPVVI